MGVGYTQNWDMRPRDILAGNLRKLMAATPGLRTFPQITAAGGGSNGTLDRIRRGEIATSVDTLEPLARAYGVEPWQLLVPTLIAKQDAETRPALEGLPEWPFALDVGRFMRLTEKQKGYVEARLEQAIEACESPDPPSAAEAEARAALAEEQQHQAAKRKKKA